MELHLQKKGLEIYLMRRKVEGYANESRGGGSYRTTAII